MSAPVNSVGLNLEAQLRAVVRERDELRAALVSTAAELEEWRFTNRIDELQRENDRLRASQQGARELPQDERMDFDTWAERAGYPFDSTDDARRVWQAAQRAASVPAEAVQPVDDLRSQMTYIAAHSVDDMERWSSDRLLNWAGAVIGRARCAVAAPVPAATMPQDIGRDAALVDALLTLKRDYGYISRLVMVCDQALAATPPTNVAQAAPKD